MQQRRQERKLVTVVFCDLVGFTGRAEVMDPEDVGAMLSSYHHRLRAELERHGGTVEKFIGDAVVAVFGAPAVHEDDAERAVRASIAIRDWAREETDVDVRIAVNTGEALVSVDASATSGEGLVAGDVINTAARIQVAAPVNGILVGDQTYRATRNQIAYHEFEAIEARGKSNPVTVWEVDTARGRIRAGAVPQQHSALVGRERELALLSDAFGRMRNDNEPQLVTLIGVPGSGKSRLVYELWRLVEADPNLISWRQGQCLPYGDGVSFWALAEIVKAETGILENDRPEIGATKLAESVRALLPRQNADWVERELRPLIGLSEGGVRDGARADAAFPAWQRYLEALAERGPCVLVVEDLHWADDGLLNFLDDFAAGCAGLPLLLVTTARPELLTRRPQWGGGKTNATTLSIPPLSPTDTARIVQALLSTPVLSADVQQQLIDRAGGNPLYAEEFARMLAERGSETDLAIPETVQGIIAARLDGLDPQQKRLLQDASVAGTTFWLGLVAGIGSVPAADVDHDLRQLEQREFIRRERRSSVEGEVEYAFRHLLVRDAAYGQLPRADRADRHQRTAEWMAALGRSDDHAELVAHHYLEALRYAKAAGHDVGELATAARGPLRDAGERALRLAAYPQAFRYLDAALELTPEDDPDRPELLFRLGVAQMEGDNRGAQTLAESVELLRAAGKPELAARAAILRARYAFHSAAPDEVAHWLRVVDDLTSEFPNSVVRIEALVARCGYYMTSNDFDGAIATATQALAHVEGLGRPELHARALDVRGSSRCGLGDAGGLEDSRKAIEIARAGSAIWEMQTAINNMGNSLYQLGRVSEVGPLLDEWQNVFDEMGGTYESRQWYIVGRAEYLHNIGDWDAALTDYEQFLAGIAEGQMRYLQPLVLAARGLIMLGRGNDDQARADLKMALELIAHQTDPQVVVGVRCSHATAMVAYGRLEHAREDWAAIMAYGEVLPTALIQGAMPQFAWLAVDLDVRQEALAVVEQCGSPNWTLVGRSILTGDSATAADALTRIGTRSAAAETQLRGGSEQVREALGFYESVGATRFASQALAALETTA
jgi:class 3 adenylate cyclase/tetratricopeptide (TPR) repeat protein